MRKSQILLTNIDYFPGMKISRYLGLVSGSTIRAKHVGTDFLASFKNLVGGELTGYTDLLNQSQIGRAHV